MPTRRLRLAWRAKISWRWPDGAAGRCSRATGHPCGPNEPVRRTSDSLWGIGSKRGHTGSASLAPKSLPNLLHHLEHMRADTEEAVSMASVWWDEPDWF